MIESAALHILVLILFIFFLEYFGIHVMRIHMLSQPEFIYDKFIKKLVNNNSLNLIDNVNQYFHLI